MLKQMLVPELDPTFDPSRAAVAGGIATFVYLGIMYADMAITHYLTDDLLLVGRPFTADKLKARLLGFIAHLGFGTTLGLIYGALVRRRLPGSGWARGIIMALMENSLLWPLTFLVDRYHPAVCSGEMPHLNRPIPIAQELVRHIGFGVVLGALYGRGKDNH
jgi:hypothetical protein